MWGRKRDWGTGTKAHTHPTVIISVCGLDQIHRTFHWEWTENAIIGPWNVSIYGEFLNTALCSANNSVTLHPWGNVEQDTVAAVSFLKLSFPPENKHIKINTEKHY